MITQTDKDDLCKALEETFSNSKERRESGSIMTNSPENDILLLHHLKEFIQNSDKYYVFQKCWSYPNDNEDTTYYKYSFDLPVDEDEFPNHYDYNELFMEVHFKEDPSDKQWKDKIVIFANNGCDRMCCGTWEIIEFWSKDFIVEENV